MAITKLCSREFNQDTNRAKRAAKRGPVFITDRGRPSHVLLTAEEYQRITGGQKSIADLLAMMSIHENLPPQARKQLKEVGWAKGIELVKLARRDRQNFDCATWLHKARQMPKEDFKKAVEKELTGRERSRGRLSTSSCTRAKCRS